MSTGDQLRPTAEYLGSRLEFETLISDLSSRFINLRPGEVDREIEDALRRVCELLGIDLAVLWQWSGAAPAMVISLRAAWMRIAVRVAGSWVAAIGLLMLGWALRGGVV